MPTQLTEWFGAKVREWRLLQIYRIHHALPFQTSPLPDPGTPYRRLGQGLFVCGEYCAPASLL